MFHATLTHTDPISPTFDGLSRAYPKLSSDLCTSSTAEHECAIRLSYALQRVGLVPIGELAPQMKDEVLGKGCSVKNNASAKLGQGTFYLQLRAQGLAELLDSNSYYIGRAHKYKGSRGECGAKFKRAHGGAHGIAYWVQCWISDTGAWRNHIDLWDSGNIKSGRSKAEHYLRNATEIWFWPV